MVLDTHVLVWLDEGSERLGKDTLRQIDLSLKAGELHVSAISFWEVAMLYKKGRLQMQIEPSQWRRSLLDNGLKEISLSGECAINSALLKDFHGDPADRMIVATAKSLSASLCTADEKILRWQGDLERIDAST